MTAAVAPAGWELLDVHAASAAERFLTVRAASGDDLEAKSAADLADDVVRHPGELLHLVTTDDRAAAMTFTIVDEAGAGSTYVTVFARTDPGEPELGSLVAFAAGRARAGGALDVRCGDTAGRPHLDALVQRHDFVEHDRWRRFAVDLANPPAAARPPTDLPAGISTVTLATRPDLVDAAFDVHRTGLADAAGDFPRPLETAAGWAAGMDASSALDRALVLLLLHGDDDVVALVELERLAAGSTRAEVGFLAVAREHRGRGMGRLAKQLAVPHALDQGLTNLHTVNHADNAAICALNETLGWREEPVRIALRRPLPAIG